MIIDTHAHIFPGKIASKASESISEFYQIPMAADGSVEALLDLGERGRIDRFVVHSVATTEHQVISINDFIMKEAEEHADKFIGFAAMHPDFPDIASEVERVIKGGLKGIKIHPDFQKFLLDDERAFPLYESIEGRLPILIHMGDSRYEYSKPWRLARVLDRFPKLTVIGAHFAGYSEWDDAAKALEGRGVYVDTSSSMFSITAEKARELIDVYGVDHVLFASDYPMWRPEDELVRLSRVSLTDEEREQILYKNAARLLRIDI